MLHFKRYPFFQQHDAMDCGAACLRMVAAYYGKSYSMQDLRKRSYADREGVSILGINKGASSIGFQTLVAQIPLEKQLHRSSLYEAPLPAILHWGQNHFVVLYRLQKNRALIGDPAQGLQWVPLSILAEKWIHHHEGGLALLLEPEASFYAEERNSREQRAGWGLLWPFLRPHRRLFVQLGIGLLLASFLQLLLPLLTQSMVDFGINNQDLQFITLVLIGQLTLFMSQTIVQFIQSWILLHVSTRINVAFVSAFLLKLMRLPLAFFDTKLTGDLLQRIGDHRRVELFLTTTALGLLFSLVTFLVFGLILLWYSPLIFGLFLLGGVLYVGWLLLFLRQRAVIDQQRFDQLANNQNALIEIIQGMPEIKLQNSAPKHRWEWATVQAKLFRANIRSLRLSQYQDAGAALITQVKDIFITFLAARAVVQGEMTLGMLLAVQFIVGQLNGPLLQWVQFIRTAQDARLSLERLGEIHREPDEPSKHLRDPQLALPADLELKGLSFRYNALYDPILQDIEAMIPAGKVTAIVGASGSGKTTLLKLLLGIYPPEQGQILLGGSSLSAVPKPWWRDQCGTVLADGYLFSKSIAENIAEHGTEIDPGRLQQAVQVACLEEFLARLPNGLQTLVGPRGHGLSQGQRQRLLIARAVYKNPSYLFFDEATNALDAVHETRIMAQLEAFFAGRTVILVAHRLSTVKNADQILVLDQGRLVERGGHAELVDLQGVYYQLVQEQLHLGA